MGGLESLYIVIYYGNFAVADPDLQIMGGGGGGGPPPPQKEGGGGGGGGGGGAHPDPEITEGAYNEQEHFRDPSNGTL